MGVRGDFLIASEPTPKDNAAMSKLIPNLDSLSVDERLTLIDELWNSLRSNPDAVPLTDAQRSELDRRLDVLDRDGGGGIPWSEVLRNIGGASQ